MRLAGDCRPQVYSVKTFPQRLAMLDPELQASLLAVLPDSCNICIKRYTLGPLFRGELLPSLSRQLHGLLSVLRLLHASSGSRSEGRPVVVDHFGAKTGGYGLRRRVGEFFIPSYYLSNTVLQAQRAGGGGGDPYFIISCTT